MLLSIAARLPEWFTPRGLEHLALDIRFQHRRAAELKGVVAGFLSFFVHEGEGRIGWLAVDTGMHRRGIGRALLADLEAELGAAGVPAILVETLGDSAVYEPYARTRAFYRALGYRDHHRVFGDNPECPEALTLRKPLPVLLHRYVAAHNAGVRTRDFAALAALFAPGATLEFAGLPIGPFDGAEAIRRAFQERPPDDLLEILESELGPDSSSATFGWSVRNREPAGKLILRAHGDAIVRLTVFTLPA